MKKLVFYVLCVIAGLHSSWAHAMGGSSLVCIDGRSFIRMVYLERGCRKDVELFYSSLDLKADSIHRGTVKVKVDSTLGQYDDQCDNPRGHFVHKYLPLPIYSGVWDIFEESELIGQVSFQTILPCKIKSAATIP